MIEPFKVMVGPSAHYHQLKSGQIKYQKSKPAKPIWRILILDESKNRMYSRTFSSQPSADEIERVVFGVLDGEDLTSVQIVIPATVEKLLPWASRKAFGTQCFSLCAGSRFCFWLPCRTRMGEVSFFLGNGS